MSQMSEGNITPHLQSAFRPFVCLWINLHVFLSVLEVFLSSIGVIPIVHNNGILSLSLPICVNLLMWNYLHTQDGRSVFLTRSANSWEKDQPLNCWNYTQSGSKSRKNPHMDTGRIIAVWSRQSPETKEKGYGTSFHAIENSTKNILRV